MESRNEKRKWYFNTTLDYLEENPLLDSVIVTVKDVKDLKATAERLRNYDYVSSAE